MKEICENTIKRPAKKIPQTQQKLFSFEQPKSLEKKTVSKNPSFINKNSDTIFIGDISLREYLNN